MGLGSSIDAMFENEGPGAKVMKAAVFAPALIGATAAFSGTFVNNENLDYVGLGALISAPIIAGIISLGEVIYQKLADVGECENRLPIPENNYGSISRFNKVKEEILKYIGGGWEVQEAPETETGYHFRFISPRGYIYDDRKLILNICSICDDEYCSHSEYNIEENRAKTLCDLVEQLPWDTRSDNLSKMKRD